MNNKLRHNVDYVLIDSDDKTKTGVGILKGKFAGVLYHYGKAKIAEEDSFARITFDYTIVTTPKIPANDLMQDQEFQYILGEILTDILINYKVQNEETGNYDSEEFDI